MLRYLEQSGLVLPGRSPAGYRIYGLGELNRLRALHELRARFGVELSELAFEDGCHQENPRPCTREDLYKLYIASF